MPIKKINFADYISPPQKICEIKSLCSKPQKYEHLVSIYIQDDIDKLIKSGDLLKDDSGAYIDYLTKLKLPRQVMEVKLKHEKIFFLLHLRSQIVQLKLAKQQFDELMKSLSNKYYKNNMDTLDVVDDDNVRIEYYVNHVTSMIFQVREVLKSFGEDDGVLLVGKKGVTGKLSKKYQKYQAQFDLLCDETILKGEVHQFNDFLRNRVLHGGRMNYGIAMHKIPINSSEVYVVAIALCDYSLLEDSSTIKEYPNVRNNLYRYYYDNIVSTLKLKLSSGKYSYQLDNGLEEMINEGLQIAFNDKHMNINKLSTDEMISLLQNEEMILFMYKTWKQKKIPSLGQFSFNMSELIYQLYDNHYQLYSQIYNWVKAEHSKEILDYHMANYELINSLFHHNGYSSINTSISFDLD